MFPSYCLKLLPQLPFPKQDRNIVYTTQLNLMPNYIQSPWIESIQLIAWDLNTFLHTYILEKQNMHNVQKIFLMTILFKCIHFFSQKTF